MYFPRPAPFVGRISRPKLAGPGRHKGVALPDGWVAHLTPTGASIVTIEEFAQDLPITREEALLPQHHHQVLWRAYQSVGNTAPYHPWTRNCEHFATWLMGQEPQSSQVNGAALLGLIGGLVLLTR
jgi:Lecithin retinol acyltransferase